MSEKYILTDIETNDEYLLDIDDDIILDDNINLSSDNIITKAEKLLPEEYEKIKKELEPLPNKYYVDRRDGEGFAQCLASPITEIMTRDGWKRLIDIKEGEEVLTHTLRYKKVIGKTKFPYDDEWYIVHAKFSNYIRRIIVTKDHKFFSRKGWIKVTDLKTNDTLLAVSDHKCSLCGKNIPMFGIGWKDDSLITKYCSLECGIQDSIINKNSESESAIKKDKNNNSEKVFNYVEVVVDSIEVLNPDPEKYEFKYAYNIEVEDDHSYISPMFIHHNCHLRGILPEDYDAYQAGKKSFVDIMIGHSLHMELRYKLKGLEKLVQYVITESDIDSYLRMMKGELNPHQKGASNVQRALIVAKPSGEPPEKLIKEEKEKEVLLNKESAKKIEKYMIHDQSYFISPGQVGSYESTYAYLALIWRGKVREGVQRPDFHELFLFPDSDLPNINKELFNGRFLVRCFRQNNDKMWWMWKATKDKYPLNPYCEIDKGFHYLTDPKNVKYIGKEEYPEWKNRKDDCTKK